MRSLNLPYNPKIDEIRCLAATLVFLFHFYLHVLQPDPAGLANRDWNWLALVTEGHTGVGLFFTLSGFLFMQIALHHRTIDYGAFIRNRFLRIFPLFVTIFFVAISIGRDQFRAQDIFYLFFSNLGDAPTSKTFITGAAWTISVEFAFYLVFPFLSRFAIEFGPRYLVQLLGLMLIIKLGAYGMSAKSTHMFFSTLVGRFDQFIIGMLAAFIYQRHHERFRRHRLLLLAIALAVVLGNSMVQSRYGSFYASVPSVPFWITWSMQESAGWTLFILAWLAADLHRPTWLHAALRHGGQISFSFYMLHALVIYLAFRWFGIPAVSGVKSLDAAAFLVLVYTATWAVATLSYTTIEKPFLSLRHRYGAGADRS